MYFIIRDGAVVQEIDAIGADNAYLHQKEEGDLYVKCGPPSSSLRPLMPLEVRNGEGTEPPEAA